MRTCSIEEAWRLSLYIVIFIMHVAMVQSKGCLDAYLCFLTIALLYNHRITTQAGYDKIDKWIRGLAYKSI